MLKSRSSLELEVFFQLVLRSLELMPRIFQVVREDVVNVESSGSNLGKGSWQDSI